MESIVESVAGKFKAADMVNALKKEVAACHTKIKNFSDEITEMQQHIVL